MKLDTQAIEILGRNRLVSELIRAGLEVAFPIRDRGIDLIAYGDRLHPGRAFPAVPIQMKCALNKSFSIDKKFEKSPQLLIAYVWGIEGETHETFVMTYQDALKIASDMGYTNTPCWKKEKGKYASCRPGKKLEKMIREFQMTPERWREKLSDSVAIGRTS